MTFSDYLNDLFSPAFKFVGEWFYKLFDAIGFFGVFLSIVVLTIAFMALVMPFLKFGGLGMFRSGVSRVESKKRRQQQKKGG